MKRFTFILAVLLGISGCTKELRPRVMTTDFADDGNENLQMSGLVVDGWEGINNIGFCYSYKNPQPDLSSTVIDLPLTSKSFNTSIKDIPGGTIVYFRAFMVSGGEIFYGEVNKVVMKELPKIAVPCNNDPNMLIIDSVAFPVDIVTKGDKPQFGIYRITAASLTQGGPDLYFEFAEVPSIGIYTTCTSSNLAPGKVYVRYHTWGLMDFSEGRQIYINKSKTGAYTVDMCDCEYIINSSTKIPITGNFKTD